MKRVVRCVSWRAQESHATACKIYPLNACRKPWILRGTDGELWISSLHCKHSHSLFANSHNVSYLVEHKATHKSSLYLLRSIRSWFYGSTGISVISMSMHFFLQFLSRRVEAVKYTPRYRTEYLPNCCTIWYDPWALFDNICMPNIVGCQQFQALAPCHVAPFQASANS